MSFPRAGVSTEGHGIYFGAIGEVNLALVPEAVYVPPGGSSLVLCLDPVASHVFVLPSVATIFGGTFEAQGRSLSPYLVVGYQQTLSNLLVNQGPSPGEDLQAADLVDVGEGFDVQGRHAFGGIVMYVVTDPYSWVWSWPADVLPPSLGPAVTSTAGLRLP